MNIEEVESRTVALSHFVRSLRPPNPPPPLSIHRSQLDAGDVKTSISIRQWSFCTAGILSCGSSGAYLDIEFTVTGSGQVTYDPPSLELTFAGSGSVRLLDVLEVDGDVVGMVNGYPLVDLQQGSAGIRSTATVTVRVPKGEVLRYDPVMRRENSGGQDDDVVDDDQADDGGGGQTQTRVMGSADVGAYVEAQSESGKFFVSQQSSPSGDTAAVQVRMDGVQEVDASGNAISGQSLSISHSLTASVLASLDFTVGPVEGRAFAGLDASSTSSITVETQPIQGSTASVSLEAVQVKQDARGTIGSGSASATLDLQSGDAQFIVSVDDWDYCEEGLLGCSSSGAAVDVTLKFESQGQASVDGNRIIMEGSGDVYVQDVVSVDGQYRAMADGFPKIEVEGETSVKVTARLEKGSQTTWDPTVRSDTSAGGGDDDGSSHVAGAAGVVVAGLLASAVALISMLG